MYKQLWLLSPVTAIFFCVVIITRLSTWSLVDFIIEQTGYNELIRWSQVEINDDSIVERRETHCKGKNFVLVANCGTSLF